jgi:hypothetical protein
MSTFYNNMLKTMQTSSFLLIGKLPVPFLIFNFLFKSLDPILRLPISTFSKQSFFYRR